MLLRNFYTALTSSLSCYSSLDGSIAPEYIAEHLRPTNARGNQTVFRNNLDLLPTTSTGNTAFFSYMPSTKNHSCASLIIGSGTSEVNYTDYTIDPLLNDDGTTANVTWSIGQTGKFVLNDDGSISNTQRIVIINTTDKQITINQWGILKSSVDTYSDSDAVLLYKEKLSTPFILHGNETINIDVTVKIYPAKPIS